MNEFVYADYNASAPLCRAAAAAAEHAMEAVGNPSSVHRYGRSSRRLIEDARHSVARSVGAAPGDVVFTSGATEANAIALHAENFGSVLASAIEHDSVLAARPNMTLVPVDEGGVIRLDALESALAEAEAPVLLSLMLANNETGVVQPVGAAAELAHAAGALVHCDAVQAAGRVPFGMASLGVDYLSLSAHKIGGLSGVGALVTAPGVPVRPLVQGGGQERRRRGGTENVAGIASFGAAAETLAASLSDQDRQRRLRDGFETRILETVSEAVVFGAKAERLANTSCLAMPGVKSELQVMSFDLAGVALSAGAACSSGKIAVSPVLTAMGVPPELAECAVRVSIGSGTTEGEVERLIEVWTDIFRRQRRRAA